MIVADVAAPGSAPAVLLSAVLGLLAFPAGAIFGRRRGRYRKTVRQAGRMIGSVMDLEEIAARVMAAAGDALGVETLAVFTRSDTRRGFVCFAARGPHASALTRVWLAPDAGLVRQIEACRRPLMRTAAGRRAATRGSAAADLRRLRAALVQPMCHKGRLNGFIVCGKKNSGVPYRRRDLELIETLADQSAMAVENARAYLLIENLNRNLERKVAERTRQLEEALAEKERTMDRLIRSESLAAIGQLVAGAAHELNNPLAAALSMLQSVREDLPESSLQGTDLHDELAFAESQMQRARRIVASLLTLSRQSGGFGETVDLNAVVRDALRVLRNSLKNRAFQVKLNLADPLPPVRGNFAALGQLTMNLVNNAAQALGDGPGTLWVSTAADIDGDRVRLTCADSGPGVPAALRRDIFKPFFTTKAVGAGSGLGLYLSHEIATRHAGALELVPSDAGGARFVLTLPISRSPATVDNRFPAS